MNYRKTIGSQIFRIIISILFLFIFPTNFLANAAEDGTLKWTFAMRFRVVGSPAIGLDGTIYAGEGNWANALNSLYAINPDGTQKWALGLKGQFEYWAISPAIGLDGTIYAGSRFYPSEAGDLYAINPDGTLKWVFTINSILSPAIGLDGTIYAGSKNLYAINPQDGTLKWAFAIKGGAVNSPAIGLDGTIYAGEVNYPYTLNSLYAINPDGTQKWAFTANDRFSSPAIGSDGTLYAGSSNYLYATNPDGTQKWAFATKGGAVSSPTIGLDGTLYVGSGYHLYAINPDGTQKWAFATNGGVRSPTIGLDGTLYAGSSNYLYAINPDGTQKWSFYTFDGFGSPTIGLDGTLYAGSGSSLYAINSSSLGLANSAWPMYMHDVRHTGRAGAGQIPAPLANFDADALTGHASLAVSFSDQSMGSITSWEWNFGDGSISTEQNPSHTYTDPGTYTVTLTVSGPGGSGTESKTDFIRVRSEVMLLDVEAFITRFYLLCLDRNPDQTGLDDWVTALLDGTQTGSGVANGFVFSQEFTNKNTTNEEYLQVLYEAFFNRQPDSAGWQGWLDAMNNEASREDVLNGFIYAAEFAELCNEYGIKAFEGHITKDQIENVEAFVTRFYQLCLDRDPDAAGLKGWTDNLLNQIQTGADVANGFIYSQEFINKNTTNEGYLTILYKAFFNRDADQAGWDAWIAELNSGRDRGYVLNGFLGSQEFLNLCANYGIKPN